MWCRAQRKYISEQKTSGQPENVDDQRVWTNLGLPTTMEVRERTDRAAHNDREREMESEGGMKDGRREGECGREREDRERERIEREREREREEGEREKEREREEEIEREKERKRERESEGGRKDGRREG